MKVRTHITAGEFASVGASKSHSLVVAGTLPSAGEPSWLDKLRQFLGREVRPWLLSTYALGGDAETIERQLSTSSSFTAANATAQAFVHRWLDPLFGESRSRQFQQLSATAALPETSLTETIINRYIGASLVTLAFALAGSLLFPPLIALGTVGALYMTLPLYVDAYRSSVGKHKVSLAVVAAIDVTGTWLGGSYVASALGSLLYYTSQKLVYKTENRGRQRLVSVYGQQPRAVWVVVDGVEVEMPFEQVQVGDTVAVQAGQTIPVDGTITRGSATLDPHALTGEPQPVESGVGDKVFATMRVLRGSIDIRVEQVGPETAAAQIADTLNRTASYQLPIQSQAEAFADRVALPTLILGGVIWPLVGYQGTFAVLGANFGLTMKLVGPIVMLNYLNILSHYGILIKDGRSLELLSQVDTLVLDQSDALALAPTQIAWMRQRRLMLIMLSGDPEVPARRLAQELGIDHYVANISSEGKAALIEQLQQEGKSVCFVGDGITDALALKAAHVSVSLRGATTVATDAAQIVLMDRSLAHLPQLLDVTRDFNANLRRGFAAAFIPDAVVVGGVFLLYFGTYASLVLFNIGLLAGLGNAMWPLLKHKDTLDME